MSTLDPITKALADDQLDRELEASVSFRRWHNDLRTIRGLDEHDLHEAGVISSSEEWRAFARDPGLRATLLSTPQAIALYRLIDSRRPAELRDGACAP